MRQQALGLFVFHDGYVAQIAVELVEIEAEAYHEAVGDLEAAKVHRDLHDAARVAVQERAYRQRIRRPAGQGSVAVRHDAEAGQLEAHLELELLFGDGRKKAGYNKNA